MLEYKENITKFNVSFIPLNVTAIEQIDGSGETFFYTDRSEPQGNADVLSFYREDGSDILFFEERALRRQEKDRGDKTDTGKTNLYSTKLFSDLNLEITSTETISAPREGGNYILLKFNREHNLIENRDDIELKAIYDNENSLDEAPLCEGDFYLYGGYFLYQSGKTEIQNTISKFYWRDRLNVIHSADAIVPVNYAGRDVTDEILLRKKGDAADIPVGNNIEEWTFWVKDERFFKYSTETEDGKWSLRLKDGASVRLRYGDINIDINVQDTFYPGLLKQDGFSDYLKEEAEGKITEPLDYEKQQFVPVDYLGGTDLSDITYKIVLRPKDEEWATKKETTPEEINEYYDSEFGCSTMYEMGFEGDDIYYRRQKVTETFLRLSFYDNKDRRTQKLLYTVKLYLDANAAWKKYIDNVNLSRTDEEKTVLNIPLQFSCSEKYNYETTSEGFYLYLFPGNIKELGDTGGTIFMKAELNNAKYGRTVPLTYLPIEGDWWGNVSGYTYTATRGENEIYTDLKQLMLDMYIEIQLRYNPEIKRYEWCLPGSAADENVLTLTLLEPRITDYGDN